MQSFYSSRCYVKQYENHHGISMTHWCQSALIKGPWTLWYLDRRPACLLSPSRKPTCSGWRSSARSWNGRSSSERTRWDTPALQTCRSGQILPIWWHHRQRCALNTGFSGSLRHRWLAAPCCSCTTPRARPECGWSTLGRRCRCSRRRPWTTGPPGWRATGRTATCWDWTTSLTSSDACFRGHRERQKNKKTWNYWGRGGGLPDRGNWAETGTDMISRTDPDGRIRWRQSQDACCKRKERKKKKKWSMPKFDFTDSRFICQRHFRPPWRERVGRRLVFLLPV